MATIREIRKNAGLSTTELAARANVSVQTVHRIERGEAVSRRYVARVCNALGVAIETVDGLQIKE